MALSLGVSVGDRVSVGDSIVEVREIHSSGLMVVAVNGGPEVEVNDNKADAVTILPSVRLFVGLDKHGSRRRLAFEAPKSIPIQLLAKERGKSKLPTSVHEAKKTTEAPEEGALFMNGVFEDTLIEILKNQKAHPGQYYLQPYSPSRILLLAKSAPTPKKPITLYLSTTKSLNLVSYRAKVVGWQDKQKLSSDDLARLNQQIQACQPAEEGIYLKASDGNVCRNLISIINVEGLGSPFPVSCLTKATDGMALKNRKRAGGWVPVRKTPEWLGTTPQVVLENVEADLAARIAKSSKDSAALRQQRLAGAPKLPEVIQVVSRAYRRNEDVIVEVRHRANGTCEACHNNAPFLRATDNEPFLEVHHRKMLSEGGEDTVENALAVCPNCHRKLHFGKSDSPNAV